MYFKHNQLLHRFRYQSHSRYRSSGPSLGYRVSPLGCSRSLSASALAHKNIPTALRFSTCAFRFPCIALMLCHILQFTSLFVQNLGHSDIPHSTFYCLCLYSTRDTLALVIYCSLATIKTSDPKRIIISTGLIFNLESRPLSVF